MVWGYRWGDGACVCLSLSRNKNFVGGGWDFWLRLRPRLWWRQRLGLRRRLKQWLKLKGPIGPLCYHLHAFGMTAWTGCFGASSRKERAPNAVISFGSSDRKPACTAPRLLGSKRRLRAKVLLLSKSDPLAQASGILLALLSLLIHVSVQTTARL